MSPTPVWHIQQGVKDTTVMENGIMKEAYAFAVKLGNGDVITIPIPKDDFTQQYAAETIHAIATELMSTVGMKSDATMDMKPTFTVDHTGTVQQSYDNNPGREEEAPL